MPPARSDGMGRFFYLIAISIKKLFFDLSVLISKFATSKFHIRRHEQKNISQIIGNHATSCLQHEGSRFP